MLETYMLLGEFWSKKPKDGSARLKNLCFSASKWSSDCVTPSRRASTPSVTRRRRSNASPRTSGSCRPEPKSASFSRSISAEQTFGSFSSTLNRITSKTTPQRLYIVRYRNRSYPYIETQAQVEFPVFDGPAAFLSQARKLRKKERNYKKRLKAKNCFDTI